ncbi:PREDICTED: uncharacterized protein LOC107328969 [Acropora digitifera]|uniref:uncharacterized protein LOC107328969 n=1 Tax=Acropora digitifera TaxID=70779 RepID=UPI00077A783D|nr:PREDICTED: uncharacterized protein LOC107328969 [Acropora digitifera]
MPPKRPVENNDESEEKRPRLDESPGFSGEPVTDNTCHGCDSRVVDKVTCGLQLQNTEPSPGPSSEEQPRSPSHKPAQEAADPQDKTKSLVEQMFCDSQSLEGEQNPVPGRIFHSSSLPN